MTHGTKPSLAGRDALHRAAASGQLRYCDLPSAQSLRDVVGALARELDAAPELAVADPAVLARLAGRGRLLVIVWGAPEPAHPEEGALVVHAEGSWFQLPSGRRVDCRRRRNLCRILVRLTRARLQAPRSPLTPTDLVEAGWPDESILPEAARGRLRVAINALRGLGLRDHLFSHGHGYLLDASVPVRIAEPEIQSPAALR